MLTEFALYLAMANESPAIPATLTRFDLVCEAMSARAPAPAQAPRRLSLDLQAGRWCASLCGSSLTILRSSAREILLIEERDKADQVVNQEKIDRTTGVLTYFNKRSSLDSELVEACRVAAFSGLSAPGPS